MIKLIALPQLDALDSRLDPPLGLMYIASVLESKNIPVEIIDLCFINKNEWSKAIGYADIYGITVFTPSFSLAQEVQNICKRNNPNCLVVVGGPHPTSLPEETIQFFDCVIKGEGDFVDYLSLKKGTIVEENNKIKELDTIPSPARHLVNLKQYTRKVAGRNATSITGSRGCPYSCIFCCKDVFGHNVRYHSNERILNEVKESIEYGFNGIIFWDDTFTLRRRYLYPLCKELSKLDIYFRCNGDARTNTYEDFQRLYEAGCREICFGIESGSQKILDIIGKKTTVEKNKLAIKNAKLAGINTKAFLMIGNPGESEETVEETKRFLEEAEPDQFSLYQFTPLPGCAVWKNPSHYGVNIVDKDFNHYYYIGGKIDGGMVIETETLKIEKIKELRENLITYLKTRGQRGELQNWQIENKKEVL